MAYNRILCLLLLLCSGQLLMAQATFPENGVADPRVGFYAFTHATLVKDASTTLSDATLVIKDGRIVAVGPCASGSLHSRHERSRERPTQSGTAAAR